MKFSDLKRDESLTATYSPEDNKLRLYSPTRLDSELYSYLREFGFKYAPKQELFYTPSWTPSRAKILKKLCGKIQDEETTLEERAIQRAERFEGYQDKRLQDAKNAYKECQELSSAIPMGQPILIGHHSEKKARKQAQKIENSMHKAVKMWETSEYWEWRAKGVISNANYKDRAEVRARRVKKLEAEARKFQRNIDNAEKFISLWNDSTEELDYKRAKLISGGERISRKFTLEEFPRDESKSQYEGFMSVYSALEFISPEQAREICVRTHERNIQSQKEWLDHTNFRIKYEETILEAQGWKEPEKRPRPKQPLLVNYAGEGFKHITKEEWKKKHKDYKCTKKVFDSEKFEPYRYRQMMIPSEGWGLFPVFITDQKIVERPIKEKREVV